MTWQTKITTTVFGGSSDPNTSAYDGHVITNTELGCALPFRWPGRVPRPQVAVWNQANDRMVIVDIVDVGPWNTDDPYWRQGDRPQAESGTDMTGRKTNLAGFDLTPAAAHFIGIDGKGTIDWCFADELHEVPTV
jgi:hypothetical protein